MCAICALLDKSFPSAKQLAKTYVEVANAGVDDKDHYLVLEAKMEDRLNEQNMSAEELAAYRAEYFQEYNRLGADWNAKPVKTQE